MTMNESRTLVTGDQVKWIADGNGCPEADGVVGFDQKLYVNYVDWSDGQRTWLSDGPALKFIQLVKKAKTVNGFPR